MRRISPRTARMGLMVLALLVVGVWQVAAQAPGSSGVGQATRAELQERLEFHEWAASSMGYSAAVRAEAAAAAAAVRDRLEHGDFQPGDRIFLRVDGHPTLTDTFTVAAGPALVLPDIGQILLAGILRAELQETVDSALRRVIRNPTVVARSLVRLAITGGVTSPGFHTLDAQAVLSDAIMDAGGLSTSADLDAALVRRGDRVIIPPDQLATALADGRTLDQLGLQAGDRLHIPERPPGGDTLLRTLLFVIPSVLSILTFFL
jgi:protein involved in polysaccharide export with SLBB domain